MSKKKHPCNNTIMVSVISGNGQPLTPCHPSRARQLLKQGKAVKHSYRPFTIQLTYNPVNPEPAKCELKIDTGTRHIGLSICSKNVEYIAEEYRLHRYMSKRISARAMYRRTRRSRLRYRQARYDRKKDAGWLPPSVRNILDRHIDVIANAIAHYNIVDAYVELANFDPQVLRAVEHGEPIPEGLDYCYGPKYRMHTVRQAVFERDHYTCQICHKSMSEVGPLSVHHLLYWKDRHVDRVDEMITICQDCHCDANHQKGGILWGLEPQDKFVDLAPATQMNIIGSYLVKQLPAMFPKVHWHFTNGAATKSVRKSLSVDLPKTHMNDAYCMGSFQPACRALGVICKKRRRNDRKLQKEYDAWFIDKRDGAKKSGRELSCGRTKRSMPRNNPNNQRVYRAHRVGKPRKPSIRRRRYPFSPGDIVKYHGKKYEHRSFQNEGRYCNLVDLTTGEKIRIKATDVQLVKYVGDWQVIDHEQHDTQ